jgi:V-type H+-transporting ATPase subunit a
MISLINRKTNNCSYIEELKLYILREKSIYHAMNMLKIQNNIFHGHVWVPDLYKDKVYQCIQDTNKKYPNLPGG